MASCSSPVRCSDSAAALASPMIFPSGQPCDLRSLPLIMEPLRLKSRTRRQKKSADAASDIRARSTANPSGSDGALLPSAGTDCLHGENLLAEHNAPPG